MSAIPRPGRCSAAEKKSRVAELAAAIAAGESPLAAVKRLSPSWGVTSRRNARRYVGAVLAKWRAERKLSSSGSLDVALATRRRLYRLAVDAGDFGSAARILDAIDELSGIDEAIDDERVRQIVAPLAERAVAAVRRELAGDPATMARVANALAEAFDPGGGETSPAPSSSTNGGHVELDSLRYYREHNANGRSRPPTNGTAGPDRVVFDE